MDDISTRSIIIGVNIFVTMTIVSLVIIMFFQMQEIYGIVATTDTSIYNKFDDIYSMYHGKVETGIGLLNTLKKFEENKDEQIKIVYPDREIIQKYGENNNKREVTVLKNIMQGNGTENIKGLTHRFKLENKYNVSVKEEDNLLIIRFDSIN